MVFDVDVLGSTSRDRVFSQVNGALVVTMERDGFFNGVPKFRKEAPVLDTLVRGVCHGHVFRMGGILSHGLLLSRGPANCTIC